LRDDNNTGNWHVLVNTAGLAATDPNYTSYPNGNWRVEALGFNCTPTLRLANNNNSVQNSFMKSSSNTIKPVMITGINQVTAADAQISLYPNPTNNMLYVTCKSKNATLYVTDMLGKKIMQVNVENELTSIDANSLSNGIYFLNINTSNGLITKKFVVQR
ncbi:MAG: T9SS type A sorting domain-containing protein, partial [Bacteroidia bacterium]